MVLKCRCSSSSRVNGKGPLRLASVEIWMAVINNESAKVFGEGFQQKGVVWALSWKAVEGKQWKSAADEKKKFQSIPLFLRYVSLDIPIMNIAIPYTPLAWLLKEWDLIQTALHWQTKQLFYGESFYGLPKGPQQASTAQLTNNFNSWSVCKHRRMCSSCFSISCILILLSCTRRKSTGSVWVSSKWWECNNLQLSEMTEISIWLASTVREQFKYTLSIVIFDVTGKIPKDFSVFEWCDLNALAFVVHLPSSSVCETWISMQTQMLTCFGSQQSLLIPCQQLQWFLFVFYQTALSLSLSLFSLWLCHVRRVLGFCQFPKTITAVCAVLHHCHSSNPDLEKKIHFGC